MASSLARLHQHCRVRLPDFLELGSPSESQAEWLALAQLRGKVVHAGIRVGTLTKGKAEVLAACMEGTLHKGIFSEPVEAMEIARVIR